MATEEELKWATAIKQAAESDASIQSDALSDLEYLQHAIIAKENTDKALCRIKRLQDFKQRYGIKLDGSYEEGMRDMKQFQAAHPGY